MVLRGGKGRVLRYTEEVVRVRVREVEREVVEVMWPTRVSRTVEDSLTRSVYSSSFKK